MREYFELMCEYPWCTFFTFIMIFSILDTILKKIKR